MCVDFSCTFIRAGVAVQGPLVMLSGRSLNLLESSEKPVYFECNVAISLALRAPICEATQNPVPINSLYMYNNKTKAIAIFLVLLLNENVHGLYLQWRSNLGAH